METDIQLFNGKKIRIVKTKKELLFHAFEHPDSIANKISVNISEDPILLKFLFLKSIVEPSIDNASGTTITIPFIFNLEYDFKKSCESRDDYDRRNSKLNEILDTNRSIIQQVFMTVTKDFFGEIMYRPKIKRLFKSRTIPAMDDFDQELSKSIKNDENIKTNLESFVKTIARYSDQTQILSKLKEFTEIASDAQMNCHAIHNDRFRMPDKKNEICTALALLAKDTVFSTESVCLDCWYEKNQLPFSSDISRVTSIKFEEKCPACSENGIIHKVKITFPTDLNGLLLGETSWLYEVFIGYLISSFDFIKNVYVHKKIQPYENGEVKSGVEVDVIAITNDSKLILIEVTKQRDDSNIREHIETKIKILEEHCIPYDKIIYVTASKADQFYDIKEKNTRIFGMSHIPNLKRFIKCFIED